MRGVWGATVLVLAVPGLAIAQAEAPKSEQLLNLVLRSWRAKQEQARNIEYIAEGEQTYARGWFRDRGTEVAPSKDQQFHKRAHWIIDFERNMMRREFEEAYFFHGNNTFFSGYILNVWDGTKRTEFRPRQRNRIQDRPPGPRTPDYRMLGKEVADGLFFSQQDFPLFFAHGQIVGPGQYPDLSRIRIPLDPKLFHLHAQGVVDNRPCLVLRTTADESGAAVREYWVDPGYDNALVRWVFYDSGNQSQRIDIRYHKTNHGYLPKQWVVTQYRWDKPGFVGYVENMQVKQVRLNQNLPLSIFALRPTPGSNVKDETVDPARYYHVRQDGSLELIGSSSPLPHYSMRRYWLWGSALLLSLTFVLLLCWKKRRQFARR